MAGQALADATERMHLVGDVPALVLIGAALLVLLSGRGRAAPAQGRRAGEIGG
jgi:hypothetical protein